MDKKYWEKRKAQRMYEYMENAEETADEIAKAYYKSSIYLNEQIKDIYDRFKSKHSLSDAEARRLIGSSKTTIKKLIDKLKQEQDTVDKKEILKLLESPAYASRITRLKEVQDEIDILVKNLYNVEKERSTSHYINLSNAVYNNTIYDIQKNTGFGFSFSNISPTEINKVLHSKWSGKNYSKRIWNNTTKLASDLKEELLINILTGRSEREVAEILSKKFATGAMEARRLVRTESCYISNEMEQMAYEECGIEWYLYVATLDMKTSEECRSLDGKKFLVSKRKPGKNCPPMHPWCRSTTIGYLNDEVLANMQRRARNSETGETYKVPANMGYEEWQEKYVKNKQMNAVNDTSKTNSKLLGKVNVDYNNRKEIDSMLEGFKKEYSAESVEYSLLINPSNDAYLIKGGESSVDYEMIPDEALRDAVVIHNHPNDKTYYSFSSADVNFFLMYNIKESYAYDDKFEYFMKRTDDTIKHKITNDYFMDVFYQLIEDRDFVEIPDKDMYHEVVKKLSEEFKFSYVRRKLK